MMNADEKIEYVRSKISEKAKISPKGSIRIEIYSYTDPFLEQVLISDQDQRLIVKKLEQEGFIKDVKPDGDYAFWLEVVENVPEKPKSLHPSILKTQTLEFIARHLGELASGSQVANYLRDWGVPEELIEYPNTKWRMVYLVLEHYATQGTVEAKTFLCSLIAQILHPLMYDGNEATAKQVQEEFNRYLRFDKLVAIYNDFEEKYEVINISDLRAEEEKVLDEVNEEIFEKETKELAFLRQTENKEKISTLRKAYQALMDIVEVYCETPSNPTSKLNDAYIQIGELVKNTVSQLHLYYVNEDYALKFNRFHVPFRNLFVAEADFSKQNLGGLTWDNIRPLMHATFGEIDDLYRKVQASDILSRPVQETINNVSLLVSEIKEKNQLRKVEEKQKVERGHTVKVEISKMPILNVNTLEPEIISKKTRVSIPRFLYTPWDKTEIRFIDDNHVVVKADKQVVTTDYEGLGFCNDKTGKPNAAWNFLVRLAKSNGESAVQPNPVPDSVKSKKRELSDKLKEIFHNQNDPFDFTEQRTYKIRLSLIPPQKEEPDDLGIHEYLSETMTQEYQGEGF